MWIAVIILSVLLVLVTAYCIVTLMGEDKKISRAKKEGADELFNLMLRSGFEQRVGDFREFNRLAEKGGIVFIGDSLTQNYNVYEYFEGYRVFNRGIGGDTTAGLLSRLKESVYDLNPSIVVLLIGTNDFGLIANSDEFSVARNIAHIVEEIHAHCPDTKILLESLYPVNEGSDPKIDSLSVGTRTNVQIRKTNELLAEIKDVTYVNIHDALTDEEGNLRLEYTMEGLHVNACGYVVISEILKTEIDRIRRGL